MILKRNDDQSSANVPRMSDMRMRKSLEKSKTSKKELILYMIYSNIMTLGYKKHFEV